MNWPFRNMAMRQFLKKWISSLKPINMLQTLTVPPKYTRSVICSGRSIAPTYCGVKIRGFHVGGVEIPSDKRILYSLQYVPGIGRARAHQILCDLNIENKITKDLFGKELIAIEDEVSKYIISDDLRRVNVHDIGRLKRIQCFRGMRHMEGLPCRGQRTKTNSRTAKEKKVPSA